MGSVFNSKINTILLAGFIAGMLDILAAIFILAKGNAEGVLRFIAKGAFGDSAMSGGPEMILFGLVFHFIIAYSFTAGYFFIFLRIPALRKSGVLSGLLYGAFIWMFMNFFFLHFTHNPPRPFSIENSWKGIVILMLTVGLPIALITLKYYSGNKDEDSDH